MRVLFCIVLTLGALLGQDRSERWRQDLNHLEQELTARHPNLRSGEPRETLARGLEELRAASASATDQKMAIGIAKLLAGLNEAHTNVYLPSAGVPFPRLPIALRWFSDGLFITSAVEPHTRLIGSRVLRFGDQSAEEAYAAVRPYISSENDQWAREISQTYLLLPDVLEAAGVINGTSSVRLTVADRNGRETEIDLAPGGGTYLAGPLRTFRPEPHYLRSSGYYYWFDFLPDSRTLYLKYNQCVEMPSISWSTFLNELNEVAITWPVERLVIDLRDNTGGNSSLLRVLLEQYQQAIRAGVVSFPKGTFGIISKRSASSAVLNAIDLKNMGFTIVGESTGGKPSSWGEVQRFALPHSRLTVTVSTRFINIPGHDEISFPPDVPVDFSSSLWWAGRDAYLEAILAR